MIRKDLPQACAAQVASAGTPLFVRHAVEDDAEALLGLRQRLFDETPFMLWGPAEFHETALHERQRIAQATAQAGSCLLVAEVDGQLVGLIQALGRAAARERHVATLVLGVQQSHWGQGISTHLLRALLAWARSAGLRRLELTVQQANERARRVFMRAGFQVEGTRRCALFVNDQYVDQQYLSILLTRGGPGWI